MRQILTSTERERFARDLRRKIDGLGISKSAAARVLGITRQSLHNHITVDGPQPRWKTIRRAVRAWDMVVYAQGQRFDKAAFGIDPELQSAPWVQLKLSEAIDRLGNDNVEMNLRKDPKSLDLILEVRVKFAS